LPSRSGDHLLPTRPGGHLLPTRSGGHLLHTRSGVTCGSRVEHIQASAGTFFPFVNAFIFMTIFFTQWTSPRIWCAGELDHPDRVRCRHFLEAIDDWEIGAIKNSVGVAEAFASGPPLGELLTRSGSSFLRLRFLRHWSCHQVRRRRLTLVVTCGPLALVVTCCPHALGVTCCPLAPGR
jgi:hypothetical protein